MVRLTDQEKQEVDQLMKVEGESSLSKFVRKRLLGNPYAENGILQTINEKLTSIDKKIGGNAHGKRK